MNDEHPIEAEMNEMQADLDRASRTIDRLTKQSERISAELADAKRGEAALRHHLQIATETLCNSFCSAAHTVACERRNEVLAGEL